MSRYRQLATVMFTDIEGYTAVMQHDEQKAIALKDRHRNILQSAHKQFNGRVIQYYGDGTLSIFSSTVEAVQCALTMQQAFCEPPAVPVRIGLHSGDIIFDDEQVFGDGVNVASRIESMGMAGCVLLSDKVNDEISNQPDLKTIPVGVYHFKNVSRAVEIFALDHEGLVKPEPGSLEGKTETKESKKKSSSRSHKLVPDKSVAVLPFVNMSNDPEQDYFSSGIADEILNSLSNLSDLKVAGRTSSSQFKGDDMDLQKIGEKLGVKTVLKGTVRKQGNRLRIMVQLINVEDGFHLWAEKYDRDMVDIFAIQDEVALAVTEKLKVTLLEKDRKKITKSYTQNTEAYELYLKGRFYFNRRGSSIITGLHCFQLAIDLDPAFALPYTGYADAALMAAFYGLVPPRQIAYQARQSAEKALQLDPSLCEPYCSLGFYYTVFEWNWIEAERNFLRSISLNPGYAQAHYWYGLNFLAWVKRDFTNAEKHGKTAIEIDPYSAICMGAYGAILHCAGKFNDALTTCEAGIELDKNSFICHLYKGWSLLSLERYDDAIQSFSHLADISSKHHFAQNALILTYCRMGQLTKARALLDEFKQRPTGENIGWAITALSVAYLGDHNKAFEFLEKAFHDRDPVLLTLQYSNFAPETLKADQRFQKLLKEIGF